MPFSKSLMGRGVVEQKVIGTPDPRKPKKLTFEEWAEDSQIPYRSVETKQDLWDYLQLVWQAAQENK